MQLTPDSIPETESRVDETRAIERQVEGLHIYEDDASDSASETEVGDDRTFAIAANEANENLVGEPQGRERHRHHHSHHHSHPHFCHRRGHHFHHHHAGFPGFDTDGEPSEWRHRPRPSEGFEHHHHPHHHPYYHLPPFPPPPFGPGMFGGWRGHGPPPPSPPRPENTEGPIPPPEGPFSVPEWPWMSDRRGRGAMRGMHHHGRGMHYGGPSMGLEGFGPHHWGHCMRPGAFGPHRGEPGLHRGRGFSMHRGGPPMSAPVGGHDA